MRTFGIPTSYSLRINILLAVWFIAASSPLRAQAPSDSVAAWTRTLQTGSLQDREAALAELMRGPVSALPRASQTALIAELSRLHTEMIAGRPVGTADEGELFGDYYMNLVTAVVTLTGKDATIALVPAVAFSGHVERRVARLGDAGVDALLPLIERQYEVPSVLETLGLAWFWSDSTGAALSDQSRAEIVTTFALAASSDSSESFMGVASALRNLRDPAFLELAKSLAERVDTLGGAGTLVASRLRANVIPVLTAAAARLSPSGLAVTARRMIVATCAPRRAEWNPSRDRDRWHREPWTSCADVLYQFDIAARELRVERVAPARIILTALLIRIKHERAARLLSSSDYTVLAGSVSLVLDRLAP